MSEKNDLWCVHVLGPDTVIAQPDRETAEKRAAEWDEMFGRIMARNPNPYDPKLSAVVEPWAGSAESHAAELAEHGGNPEDIC